jgi:short-subunit dehydrogenase
VLVEGLGRKASIHEVNVMRREQMEALPQQVLQAHGHIHILMNNAGITYEKNWADQSIEELERIIGVNCWGVLYGCKIFMPYLEKEDEGHIINLSSMLAFVGLPTQSAYAMTKSAVRGFSEALWAELQPTHIGLTCVYPGAVRTDILKTAAQHSVDEAKTLQMAELVDRFAMAPEKAGKKIVDAVVANKMRLVLGVDAKVAEFLKRCFPVMIHKIAAWGFKKRS